MRPNDLTTAPSSSDTQSVPQDTIFRNDAVFALVVDLFGNQNKQRSLSTLECEIMHLFNVGCLPGGDKSFFRSYMPWLASVPTHSEGNKKQVIKAMLENSPSIVAFFDSPAVRSLLFRLDAERKLQAQRCMAQSARTQSSSQNVSSSLSVTPTRVPTTQVEKKRKLDETSSAIDRTLLSQGIIPSPQPAAKKSQLSVPSFWQPAQKQHVPVSVEPRVNKRKQIVTGPSSFDFSSPQPEKKVHLYQDAPRKSKRKQTVETYNQYLERNGVAAEKKAKPLVPLFRPAQPQPTLQQETQRDEERAAARALMGTRVSK